MPPKQPNTTLTGRDGEPITMRGSDEPIRLRPTKPGKSKGTPAPFGALEAAITDMPPSPPISEEWVELFMPPPEGSDELLRVRVRRDQVTVIEEVAPVDGWSLVGLVLGGFGGTYTVHVIGKYEEIIETVLPPITPENEEFEEAELNAAQALPQE